MEEEAILRLLMKKSPIGIYIYNLSGFLYINKAFEHILGFSHEDLKTKKVWELVYDQKNQLLVEKTIEKRIKGEFFEKDWLKLKVRSKSGSEKYVYSLNHTIDYHGKYAGLGFLIDVTNDEIQKHRVSNLSSMYQTLSEVNQTIIRINDEATLFNNICKVIVEKGLFKLAWIGIIENDNYTVHSWYGSEDYINNVVKKRFNEETYKTTTAPPMMAIKRKHIYVNNNTALNPHMLPWKDNLIKEGLLSSASIPIMKRDKTIGSLSIYSDKTNFFNKDILHLLKEVQSDIAFALDKIEDERWMRIISSALDKGFNFVSILDKDFKRLYVNEALLKISGYSRDELIGKTHSIFSSDIHGEEFTKRFYNTVTEGNIFSDILIYKKKNNDFIYGLTTIIPFMVHGVIAYYIVIGKDITNERKLQDRIYELSSFDVLTSLPNRLELIKRINVFLKREQYTGLIGALAIINIVDFSSINQAYGFEAGDKILKSIASRLKTILREYDTISRIGADRFAILIKDLNAEEDALVVLMKVLNRLKEPFRFNGDTIDLSYTIGVSFYPTDANKAEDLIQDAEVALLDARKKGENTFGFFQRNEQAKIIKMLDMRNKLNDALKNKEFVLFYQPYFDIKTGKMSGAESLIRWKHKDTIIPPMEFIPTLEQSGLISSVEDYIIDEAAKTISKLNMPISINISPKSFRRKGLVESIIQATKDYDIDPNLLTVEIVERMFIEDLSYTTSVLSSLKNLGIRISIDDFGTGYSSLTYLKNLPIDILKIDISFIRGMLENPKDLTLVKIIINMADVLNFKTIAEGVEEEKQLSILKDLDCDYAQGYLLAKPMEFERIEDICLKGGIKSV